MIAAGIIGFIIIAASASVAVVAVALLVWLAPEPRDPGPHVVAGYAVTAILTALMCGLVLLLAGDRQPHPAPTNPAFRSK